MLWIAALLMCCLQTVESQDCSKSEIIVGRLGEELVLNFTFSDLREEYNKYIAERGIIEHDRQKIMIENETNIQELKKESDIRFKNKVVSTTEQIIFIDGNPTDRSADSRTEIFLTNDAFVVKKTKLQKEDAGIYWIEFRSIRLGWKALIIAGKPTINRTSPPNPVLKSEDNYSTILQLECHSVSTSIGDCQLYNSMYIMWYKNGMRMTELDPTLSQINVTVDHNGGDFTCLATEYPLCYHRLQTTKHYDVLNIEECDNIYESETFIVKPQYGPIDVKLEPDQREITVNKNDELKVKCSAKCHPKCDAKWEKNFQDLESNGLVTLTESMFGSELKIVNINSSDEGFYSCLVNNTHGEAKKNFTLRVNPTTVVDTTQSVTPTTINNITKYETGNNLISAEMNNVIVAVTVVIVIIVFVIVIVVIVIMYKKYHKENTVYHNAVPTESSEEEEDEGIFETMNLYGGAPLIRTSRDNNNSRNGGQNQRPENIKYAELDLHTPDGFRIHGTKRKPEVQYSTIDFTKKAPPMPINIELDSDDDEWS